MDIVKHTNPWFLCVVHNHGQPIKISNSLMHSILEYSFMIVRYSIANKKLSVHILDCNLNQIGLAIYTLCNFYLFFSLPDKKTLNQYIDSILQIFLSNYESFSQPIQSIKCTYHYYNSSICYVIYIFCTNIHIKAKAA